MRSRGLKFLQLFLVLVVIASGSAYACTGSESCSMPCCRDSAKDTSHHGTDGNAKGCCDTTDASAGATGTACRLEAKDVAAILKSRPVSAYRPALWPMPAMRR
jgi:hypothetical protein